MQTQLRTSLAGFAPLLAGVIALFVAARSTAQPVITSHPQNQTAPLGYDVTFRVHATGTPPLSYQWQFGNSPIAAATNSSLRLANVQFTNAGDYSVVVSNTAGPVTSSNATLVVTPPGSVLGKIAAADGRAFVYDSARDVVFFTTATNVQRFHVSSNLFLPPFSCGLNLQGIDLAPDGSSLMVADDVKVASQCRVWVIDLATEVVQAISYDPYYDEAGTRWVAFGNDGVALVSPGGSGATPLHRIHPNGTITDLGAGLIGSFELGSFLGVSPDGGIVAITEHLSTASKVFRYSVTNQTLTYGGTGAGWTGDYRPAVSSGGAQLAAPTTYTGTFIFDSNFNVITNIAGQNGGLIYHPSNSVAFFAWSGSREIRALETSNFTELWRYDFGTNVPANTFLRTSRDGTMVLALMEGAIRFLRWTNAAPFITNQPLAQTVFLGSNLTFSVGAEGPPPLRYQWRFNGEDIEDATNAALLVNAVQFTNAGNYSVAVLGPNSFTLSTNAALIVNGPPQITAQPQGGTLPAGTNFSFTVAAIGPTPFSYRWRLFSTNLSSPNASTLSLTNLQAANAGDYTVVVSNAYGFATSQVAVLDVTPVAPLITLQPQNITAPAGTNVSFTVAASGTEPFNYQWLWFGTNLPGRTTATLMLSNIQSFNAGDYAVLVGNSVATNTSNPATLTVTPALPTFLVQPQNVTATLGAEISFNASAVGTEPIDYHWQFNGGDIPGAFGNSYSFTNAQYTNAGSFTAVATNTQGAAMSAVATLTVTPPPGWLWARTSGGANLDGANGVATDSQGNVCIAGYFWNPFSLGGSNFVGAGASDILVAKYDSAGHLLWARQAGGSGTDVANAIAVDGEGNVIVTGQTSGVAVFESTTVTNQSGGAVFVAKYDPNGALLWVKAFDSPGSDAGHALATDQAGNIYVAGGFDFSVTFGSTTLMSTGAIDGFVAKFNASGAALWARQFGGVGEDKAQAVAVDPWGSVLVAGHFRSGSLNLDGFNFVIAQSGYDDVFVAKLDAAGRTTWARSFPTAASDIGLGLAADGAGSIFLTSNYRGTRNFSGVVLSSVLSSLDVFLCKLDAAGTQQWVRSEGGGGSDLGVGLAVDAGGTAYVSGRFSQTATFGSSVLTTVGAEDVFVASYGGDGVFQWARKAGGSETDWMQGIALDAAGGGYVAGIFNFSVAQFGGISLTNPGSQSLYLAKLALVDASASPGFTVQPSAQIAPAGANVIFSSGFTGAPPVAIQWRFNDQDIAGANGASLILSNVSMINAGFYSVVLSNANGAITSAVATVSVTIEPDFVWARRGGGASNDVALASVADGSGNVFVAGYFADSADFSGSNFVSNGGEDIFVAKYDAVGSLVWIRQFGSAGNDRATSLALVTGGGGVAVGGNYAGDLTLDGVTLTNAGGSDVFLAQLDPAGNVAWAVRGGGAYEDQALAVATHSIASGIYVSGSYQTNATFGTSTFNDSTSTNRFFIAKYDNSGNFVWAGTVSGAGPSQGRALACDAGNFVFAGGTSAGQPNFAGNVLASTGALSGFVVKYSSGGNIVSWARRFGTATNTPTLPQRVNGLAVDTNNNVLVTGEFQGDVIFTGTNALSSLGTNQPDGFLLKIDGNGNPQWARTINGPGPDAANAVSVDRVGNAYVTGSFSNNAAIGNTILKGAGGQEAFAALFDVTGNLVKARRAGGVRDDAGQAASTDGKGNLFVAGYHSAPAAFGSNSLANSGGRDAFLTKLTLFATNGPPQITTQPRSQSVALGSNVNFSVGCVSPSPVAYQWRRFGTNISGATSNSFTLLNAQAATIGEFTVRVQNASPPPNAVTSEVAMLSLELTPEFLWLRRSGGTGDDQAFATATDGTNAVYVAGLFTGTNPAFTNLTSAGGTDIFLTKYDGAGNLLWAKRAGGTSADAAQAIRVDKDGNILVAGYFYSSTATFGAITVTNKSSPVAGFSDLFLAKYDSEGNALWVKSASGSANDQATAIALDDGGNAYLTGSFHAGAVFGNIGLTNSGSTNMFVAKFDPDGNVLWARTTSGTNYSQGSGVCVDAETNVYLTGFLFGSLNLGSGSITNTNSIFTFGNATSFVAKYDRDGNLQWLRRGLGGSGFGQNIMADRYGAIYATAYKRDYGQTFLLTKYDVAGNVIWTRTNAIGCCTSDYLFANGLALDAFGNPVLAGGITGSGTQEGLSLNSSIGQGFVVKYRASDGTPFWVQRLGAAGYSAAMDAEGKLYLAGRFTGTSAFGTSSNLVSAGGNDAFLTKVGVNPPAINLARSNFVVVAGSNTTLQVSGVTGAGPFTYQWQFNGTNLAGATGSSYALNGFQFNRAGRYAVVVSSPAGSVTGQVAAIGLIPVLGIYPDPSGAIMKWSGQFMLQTATNLSGPYYDLPGVLSPVTNTLLASDTQRFFRLRVSDPVLAGYLGNGGTFCVGVTGSPGRIYRIEGSTNLTDWLPLIDEASPFGFADTNALLLPWRFYRAKLVP